MEYTKSVSGFSTEGKWVDVVEMGERVSFALSNTVCYDYSRDIERFNSWRPKAKEDLSTDMNRKTSRQASLDTDDKRIDSDVEGSFVQRLYSLLYNSLLEGFSRTEEYVYQNLMTKVSPYYFDSQLLSANLRRKDTNLYKIEINVNDDDIKTEVAEKLLKYDEEYDRWHIGLEFDASTFVSSEGIENNIQRSDVDDYNPQK